jgi:hypothetical protein
MKKTKTVPTIAEIKQKALPILERYGVTRAGVFGSVATGKVHQRSDIDLAVDLGRPIGLFDFVGLKLELQEALDHKVDLVEYAAIKPLLKERILAQHVTIL